ncbi:MAG: Gfo/Idh/MocA family oxidoreductase [Planctomycetia bacterium]|nr:Gfo/Idh/MocA family oxidoreductase [Planctomycetia bacterium]
MKFHNLLILFVFCSGLAFSQDIQANDSESQKDVFRIGIIGTTTSHVPAFVNVINDPNAEELFQKFEITAAYKGGMPDNPDSWNRVEQYAAECSKAGIVLYRSIEELVENVDGVLLESVDGRPHLEQAKPVIAAGKPMFIDKPIAGSLSDVLEIFRLSEEKGVPIFSASSLRYISGYQKMRNEQPLGKIWGCDTMSPCSLNRKHPDFYWYGVHGVESLFTIMGSDCLNVSRTHTEGVDLAVGLWKDGRIGTFRGIRQGASGYSAKVYAENGIEEAGTYEGYKPLVVEICKFFDSNIVPIEPQETINIFAFMSAADESLKLGGIPVSLEETIAKARDEKQITVELKMINDSSILWNDENTEISDLSEKIDSFKQTGNVVRIILDNRAGLSFEIVEKVLAEIDNAYLANYLY